jgi:stage II sporulation protein D
MRWFLLLFCVLISNKVFASERIISIQILSKYHPKTLIVETRSRIFHLDPQTSPQWEFTAPAQQDISITVNGETRIYRGTISAHWNGTEYQVSNRTPLEIYVAGVVTGELGSKLSEQLIKAQAILARTYALKTLQRGPLYDLAYHQVFKGFDHYAQKVYPISMQSQNQVLKQHGQLADVLFHAECGSAIYHAGEFWDSHDTAPAIDLPDSMAQGQPWKITLSNQQISKVFPGASKLSRNSESQPVKIAIGQDLINIESFRLGINRQYGWNTIPSNEFTIEQKTEGWLLKGRGRGHLVGLCQQQSNELAGQGWQYQEILKLFYPTLTIEKLN